jgi:hypothetical protein
MQYWDASALAPLCVEEPTSAVVRALAARASVVTWCLSAVEVASAIERRAREGALSPDDRTRALANLADLGATWVEVRGVAPVRERALRLLATHTLRAADALQLAAALVVTANAPAGHEFICLDARLRDAAAREGFATPAVTPRTGE